MQKKLYLMPAKYSIGLRFQGHDAMLWKNIGLHTTDKVILYCYSKPHQMQFVGTNTMIRIQKDR